MSYRHHQRSHLRALAVLAVLFIATLVLIVSTNAHADVIETSSTQVTKVKVTYAEPMPTRRFPNRTYFETNDGSAYRFINYARCVTYNVVPTRVCRTVFWYAR